MVKAKEIGGEMDKEEASEARILEIQSDMLGQTMDPEAPVEPSEQRRASTTQLINKTTQLSVYIVVSTNTWNKIVNMASMSHKHTNYANKSNCRVRKRPMFMMNPEINTMTAHALKTFGS